MESLLKDILYAFGTIILNQDVSNRNDQRVVLNRGSDLLKTKYKVCHGSYAFVRLKI